MESIYLVLTWLCHRTCPHCYEDRFRPYYGEDLERVATEARTNVPRIIGNLPERMMFRTPEGEEKRGRVILAGGEVLLEPVRESVLYPALEQLREKYRGQGGIEVIVQTTGDIISSRHIAELLDLGVTVISVSGMDHYHAGFEQEETRLRQMAKLTAMFGAAGMEAWIPPPQRREGGRYYHFFGATPDSWIGKLWPRGRAQCNELSRATVDDNFCNGWSGGLNFLEYRSAGSEVSIDPDGHVYPCCLKTRLPLGSLLETPLEGILRGLRGDPVYEAINAGQPQRMGVKHGWSEEKFLEKSRTTLPSGREYQNLCIGCDRFHEEVLAPMRNLVQIGV